MSTGPDSLPPLPGDAGDEGIDALVAAMEGAPAAIYCVSAAAEPVWANARARALGADRDDMPAVDGHRLVDLVDGVLRTGRPETVCGPLGVDGPSATVMVRPMRVGGGRGALIVLESDDAATDTSLWPRPADVVEQAQLSLLPPSLPVLPDLRLSGSYHRATSARAAGGDWYDAVSLGSGRMALVVGDAVGHGVPAAGAMSRLRGAMRSSALRDPSPGAVTAALDAFAVQMDDVEGASVLYAVLDAGTGDLTYAAAGHPPPLVVGADGAAAFLPLTPRPPLGSVPGAATVVAQHVLEQGATLVLFSNGVVAGPPRKPTTRWSGWRRWPRRDHRARRAGRGRTDRARRGGRGGRAVAGGMAGRRGRSRGAPPGGLRGPAAPGPGRRPPRCCPGIRRRLGSWLTALGMGEQDRVGVMVAVGEACANAAEHAYRGREPGPMSVTAQVDVDGVLTVVVRDEGAWRPPDRDPG